jgi:prepilin-type N-terminal cleavage/methylation domain-containing protein
MKKNKAVTLIELLITSAIFVVVMVAIYSAFQTGIFGYRDIEENIQLYQSARQILERINLDLRNSFAFSKDETKFIGSKNEISFLTLVDSFTQDKIMQDYALVAYKLEEGKFTRLCRKNQQALNEKSEIEPLEFAENVAELSFSYAALPTSGQSIEWKDSWEDTKKLPTAVRVELTLKNKIRQEFERQIFLINE